MNNLKTTQWLAGNPKKEERKERIKKEEKEEEKERKKKEKEKGKWGFSPCSPCCRERTLSKRDDVLQKFQGKSLSFMLLISIFMCYIIIYSDFLIYFMKKVRV